MLHRVAFNFLPTFFSYKNLVCKIIKPWICSEIINVVVILLVAIVISFEGPQKKTLKIKKCIGTYFFILFFLFLLFFFIVSFFHCFIHVFVFQRNACKDVVEINHSSRRQIGSRTQLSQS